MYIWNTTIQFKINTILALILIKYDAILINMHIHAGHGDFGCLILTYMFRKSETVARTFQQQAFLPDSRAGKEALELLVRAFQLGHTFHVNDDSREVVWATPGVAHKTARTGGKAMNGWPCESYFDDLKADCARLGIHTKADSAVNSANLRKAADAFERAGQRGAARRRKLSWLDRLPQTKV